MKQTMLMMTIVLPNPFGLPSRETIVYTCIICIKSHINQMHTVKTYSTPVAKWTVHYNLSWHASSRF